MASSIFPTLAEYRNWELIKSGQMPATGSRRRIDTPPSTAVIPENRYLALERENAELRSSLDDFRGFIQAIPEEITQLVEGSLSRATQTFLVACRALTVQERAELHVERERLELVMSGVAKMLQEIQEVNPEARDAEKQEARRYEKELLKVNTYVEHIHELFDPVRDHPPARLWKRWAAENRTEWTRLMDWMGDWIDGIQKDGGQIDPKALETCLRRAYDGLTVFLEFNDNIAAFGEDLERVQIAASR